MAFEVEYGHVIFYEPLRSALKGSHRRHGISSSPGSQSSPISEIDVLWITAGLGCDGDTIAMTAATQPSIEDIVFGALPWIPKVHFHNPFLAIVNGDEFMERFHLAAEGKSNPFILVLEGFGSGRGE